MTKAIKIKEYPNYYITDTGIVYSRCVTKFFNTKGRIKRLKLRISKKALEQITALEQKDK